MTRYFPYGFDYFQHRKSVSIAEIADDMFAVASRLQGK
jgi:hypothetical protein